MIEPTTIRELLHYGDHANDLVFRSALPLSDEALDRPFDMGRGSLRLTLMHIHVGEAVWLQRWRGRTETKWPDEAERAAVATIHERFAGVRRDRDAFLADLSDAALRNSVTYRDSKGSLYNASLGQMMVQLCVHSAHHRAQAVNMIRRAGGQAPEVDYMVWVRKPVA